MPFSIGTDIEEVKRFHRLIRNRRFLNRVFTREEIRYCRLKKHRSQHFAVRFAAKEAVWKAMSEFLRRKKIALSHKSIGLKNNKDGKPHVVLPLLLKRYEKNISVSLSHTRAYAVAVAIFSR